MKFSTPRECKLRQNWRTSPTISKKKSGNYQSYSTKIGELLPQLAKFLGDLKKISLIIHLKNGYQCYKYATIYVTEAFELPP